MLTVSIALNALALALALALYAAHAGRLAGLRMSKVLCRIGGRE